MTGETFDPGPGWREVIGTHSIAAPCITFSDGTSVHRWVRQDQVPPLPTEPYTVIRAEWRKGGHTFLVLTPVGWQDIDGNVLRSGGEPALAGSIAGFEVLAEPRAVTAKAVLDRVMITGISGPVVKELYREFGVAW